MASRTAVPPWYGTGQPLYVPTIPRAGFLIDEKRIAADSTPRGYIHILVTLQILHAIMKVVRRCSKGSTNPLCGISKFKGGHSGGCRRRLSRQTGPLLFLLSMALLPGQCGSGTGYFSPVLPSSSSLTTGPLCCTPRRSTTARPPKGPSSLAGTTSPTGSKQAQMNRSIAFGVEGTRGTEVGITSSGNKDSGQISKRSHNGDRRPAIHRRAIIPLTRHSKIS